MTTFSQIYAMARIQKELDAKENFVRIIKTNGATDFQNCHASVQVGDIMYIGTRADGVTPAVLVTYNKNDLTVFKKIQMPLAGPGVNGLECICYNAINNKLYAPLSNTKKILIADASDITNYQIVDIGALPAPIVFTGSCGIETDGVSLFIGTEQRPEAYFVKIRCADMTCTHSKKWVGIGGVHGSKIDVQEGFVYFSTNGGNCYQAIVSMANLDYTQQALSIGALTDDFALIKPSVTGLNLSIFVSETRNPGDKGGKIVDNSTGDVYDFDALPSFGLFFDEVNLLLYSTCIDGFIEVWTIDNLIASALYNSIEGKTASDVYNLRGKVPNEMFIFENELFVTFWNNTEGGSLAKIELNKTSNTLATKRELIYRTQ